MNKKRFLELIFFFLLLFAVRAGILYLIEPVDYSIFFNQTLKNKAAQNGNHLDMVFVGASRPQRTFDPDVFEKELGLDAVFNISSGLQSAEASYYMLKEVTERYHPTYAVLGVTSGTLFNDDHSLAKVIVFDRLHGLNKLDYFKNYIHPEEYLNSLSLCYRFRNNLNSEFIRKNIQEKAELRANHYAERWDDPDLYKDNGFIYSFQIGDIESSSVGTVDLSTVRLDMLKYLEKIVSYCEEQNVQLFLVIPPRSMSLTYSITNYQEVVDFYSDFANSHNVPFTNLNYLYDRENWLGDDMMFDSGHVNGEGAEQVSEKYAAILKAIINNEEVPDLFYHDDSEMKADVNRILSVGADIQITNLIAHVHIRSIQSENIHPLYRIFFSADEENFIQLTDWTDKTDFEFDLSDYRGTAHFRIEAMSPSGEPGTEMNYFVLI